MAAAKTAKIDSEAARAVEAERVRQAEEHRARSIAQAQRLAMVPKPVDAAPTPPAAPAPVVEKPKRFIDCARLTCSTHLVDLVEVGRDPEVIRRWAAAHGRVLVTTEAGDRFFCDEVCRAHELGRPGAAKVATARAEPKPPARVHAPHGVLQCDHVSCIARTDVTADPKFAARAAAEAAAKGWVATENGVFCGKECARKARLDVEAGIGTRADLQKHPERGSFIATG